MEVKLNEKEIEKSITDNIGQAVNSALQSYEIQKSITEIITTDIAHGAIRDAVKTAICKMDSDSLVMKLASEIEKATTKAVVNIINEAVVDIVCKIRGIGMYSDEDQRKREKIMAEIIK